MISSKDKGGKSSLDAFANILFPVHGAHTNKTLCIHAIAIHIPLFATRCHCISSKLLFLFSFSGTITHSINSCCFPVGSGLFAKQKLTIWEKCSIGYVVVKYLHCSSHSLGIQNCLYHSLIAARTPANTPSVVFIDQSNPSSQKNIVCEKNSSCTGCMCKSKAVAIAKSKILPVFLVSDGARFMINLFGGISTSQCLNTERKRSFDSFMLLSGSQMISIAGSHLQLSTSIFISLLHQLCGINVLIVVICQSKLDINRRYFIFFQKISTDKVRKKVRKNEIICWIFFLFLSFLFSKKTIEVCF